MITGTALFLEESDFIKDKQPTFENILSGATENVRTASIVLNLSKNEILKNRFSDSGIIIPRSISKDLKTSLSHKIDINKAYKSYCEEIDSLVAKRVKEILPVICKSFDVEEFTIYWHENINYQFYVPNSNESEIKFYNCNFFKNIPSSILLGTIFWHYREGFPKKFLFMKNEDIESYIREEILREAKAVAEDLIEKEKSRIKKQEAIEKALSKLSDEDKKVLGLH